ncbi:hypothetical protein BT93_J1399 [Corymbia citriodora subsp. variegata]|nr:hypothetical protein BT93_J1399 [Corymbia citriodora subsp. variegata]
MVDIWKPSKKEKWSNGHSTSSSSPSSSSSKFALPRSFSAKAPSSNSPGNLARSGSQRCSLSSKGSLSRSCSHKGSSNISRKCSNIAKEQKAKFYIMKRCVAMLLRWHKHDDS